MADEGGFNLGGGFVTIDADTSPAEAKVQALEARLGQLFQGAQSSGIGASGMGPVAGGMGAFAMGGNTPAGGSFVQATGFANMPAAISPMAYGQSAFTSIMPGPQAGGGTTIEVSTGGSEQNVKQVTGAVRELADQLELLKAAAAGGADVGGAIASVSRQLGAGQPNTYIAGGVFGSQFTQSAGPNVVNPGMNFNPGVGFAQSAGPNVVNPGLNFNPGQGYRQSAGPNVVTTGGSYMGTYRQSAGPNVVHQRNTYSGDQFLDAMGETTIEDEASSFAEAAENERWAASRGAGRSGGAGGRGGRTGGFGIAGAISRATGIPYAGVIGLGYAVHAATSLGKAYADYNPDINRNELYNPGALVDLSGDSSAAEYSQRIAKDEAYSHTMDAVPGWSLLDLATGDYRTRQHTLAANRQHLGVQAYMQNASFEQRQGMANARGQTMDMFNANAEATLAPLVNATMKENTAENRAILQNQADINGINRSFAQGQYNASLTGMYMGAQAADTDALAGVMTQAGAAFRAGSFVDVTAMSTERAGVQQLGNTLVSQQYARSSLALRLHATEQNFTNDTDVLLAGIKDDGQRMATQVLRESQLNALRQNNLGQLGEADATVALTQQHYNMERSLAPGMEHSRVAASNISSYGYEARASGNRFGASLIGIAAGYVASGRIVDPTERANVQSNLASEELALRGRHTFEVALQNEGYDARIAAAGEAGAYHPLTAQATMSVARARQEISMAETPEQRAKVTATVAAELDTQAKLMTSDRGGRRAMVMSGDVALGVLAASNLDLDESQADRRGAAATLQAGKGNLGSAQQAPQITLPGFDELKKSVMDFLGKYDPAAVSFLTRR